MKDSTRDSDDGREETELERLDRNMVELLNELRVAQTGVQVLFAFLLVGRPRRVFGSTLSRRTHQHQAPPKARPPLPI